MVSGTAPLRERPEQLTEWDRGYHPDISSDGAAQNGEGVSTIGGSSHITTAPAGLLPGGLALSTPVDSTRITSPFGWRLNPTGPGAYIHIGQDYGVPCGTPVRAAEDGTVVQSAWAGHSGQRVRVDHGSGVETAYSHNSLLVVHVGDTVRRGDLLALSGTTGNSTGCHVHFEVYLNGKWVDPARYLPLLAGHQRPVTPDERRDIEDHRASPQPADRTTTAASAAPASPEPVDQPEPSEPSGASGASGADRKEPAGSAPRTTSPRPDPTPPASHPAPARTAAPPAPEGAPEPTQAATRSTAPSPTASPKPAPEPTTPPTASATPTPAATATSSASPATPAEPTSSATASPSTGTPPADEATASPSPATVPTPSPTPTKVPTPAQGPRPKPGPADPTPTSPPSTPPPADEPPTLAALCLAYLDENAARTADAGAPPSRILGRVEMRLLAQALEETLPTARPLPEQPTVAQVADRCPVWFPHGMAEDTVQADLAALPGPAVPGARSGGGTRK